MRNTIVVRMARALRSAGLVTLRFNFRGVEGSEGLHEGSEEIEDAARALAELERLHSRLSPWVAGYSFGARIAAELTPRAGSVERAILVAYPSALYGADPLAGLGVPGLVLLGGEDPFGAARHLERALPSPPAGLEVLEIPGADHFFRGRTPLVEEAVARYARSALER